MESKGGTSLVENPRWRWRHRSLALVLALGLAPSTAVYDCPDDKIQDAYRISVGKKDKHYGHCSQVCLSPGLRNVAAKHGVRYGSSCIEQGCADFVGEDSNAGQHFYLFTCPQAIIQAQLPSPHPPPAPSSPPSPPWPPAPASPPPVPSPPPFTGERSHYMVKYTDMACGRLIATRVQSLERCADTARQRGNHFFSYNQWWKFCLACEASELAQCGKTAVELEGCHYQVRAGAGAAQRAPFGGPLVAPPATPALGPFIRPRPSARLCAVGTTGGLCNLPAGLWRSVCGLHCQPSGGGEGRERQGGNGRARPRGAGRTADRPASAGAEQTGASRPAGVVGSCGRAPRYRLRCPRTSLGASQMRPHARARIAVRIGWQRMWSWI
jgi:hypothetical protein